MHFIFLCDNSHHYIFTCVSFNIGFSLMRSKFSYQHFYYPDTPIILSKWHSAKTNGFDLIEWTTQTNVTVNISSEFIWNFCCCFFLLGTIINNMNMLLIVCNNNLWSYRCGCIFTHYFYFSNAQYASHSQTNKNKMP